MKFYKTKCAYCGEEFERKNCHQLKYQIKYEANRGIKRSGNEFCNLDCAGKFKKTAITEKCGWCNKDVTRNLATFKGSKSRFIFCDNSCSASYNNTQRRKSRRSKCEILLFNLLKDKYTKLEVIPNDKILLNGLELDIAFPELKLAVEWNGIVHFKPIYGEEKLNKIKSIDAKKQIIAVEKGIRLIVIPDLVSNEKYVKEAFFNICKIIDELLINRV